MEDKYNAIVSLVSMDAKDSGLLQGFDVAIKDNINMKGTKTTASSKMLENYESNFNATVVDRLIDAGANIVAKATMDELAMGGSGRNAVTGPTLNPLDTSRITGGSSSGSAALVAGGQVRLALGSDTGDSIRKPASYCGIVGLKPTYGRISRYGVTAFAASLDHVGLFGKNVADVALGLEVIAGRDDLDLQTSQLPVENYSDLEGDLKGKRIGIFNTVHEVMDQNVVGQGISDLRKQLEAQGAIIVEKEMPLVHLRSILPIYNIISNVGALSSHASLDGVRFGHQAPGDSLEEIMINSRTQGIGSQARVRYIFGAYASAGDNMDHVFVKAKKVRRVIVESYLSLFEDIDALVVMASGQIAPLLSQEDVYSNDDAYTIGENHLALQNFSGLPSITIPFASYESMPIGINITTKAFAEKELLSIAAAIEKEVA